MNVRYDQIDESDLINAIDQIEVFFQNVDQNVDQTQNQYFKLMELLQIRKNPVRGGCLTGFVGGGNEGKEETSFRLLFNYATTVPFEYM
jgi:hypothetical protein